MHRSVHYGLCITVISPEGFLYLQIQYIGLICLSDAQICFSSAYTLVDLCPCRPEESSLTDFGLNWPAVWVQMACSWLCVLIFMWTIFVPTCIPGRDFSVIPGMDTLQRKGKRRKRGEDDGAAGSMNSLDLVGEESGRGRRNKRSKDSRETMV